MIQDLKNEDIINKVGGRFRLTALIQKRWKQLMMGARPLIEPGRMTPMEIAIREIIEDKIAYTDSETKGGEQDA